MVRFDATIAACAAAAAATLALGGRCASAHSHHDHHDHHHHHDGLAPDEMPDGGYRHGPTASHGNRHARCGHAIDPPHVTEEAERRLSEHRRRRRQLAREAEMRGKRGLKNGGGNGGGNNGGGNSGNGGGGGGGKKGNDAAWWLENDADNDEADDGGAADADDSQTDPTDPAVETDTADASPEEESFESASAEESLGEAAQDADEFIQDATATLAGTEHEPETESVSPDSVDEADTAATEDALVVPSTTASPLLVATPAIVTHPDVILVDPPDDTILVDPFEVQTRDADEGDSVDVLHDTLLEQSDEEPDVAIVAEAPEVDPNYEVDPVYYEVEEEEETTEAETTTDGGGRGRGRGGGRDKPGGDDGDDEAEESTKTNGGRGGGGGGGGQGGGKKETTTAAPPSTTEAPSDPDRIIEIEVYVNIIEPEEIHMDSLNHEFEYVPDKRIEQMIAVLNRAFEGRETVTCSFADELGLPDAAGAPSNTPFRFVLAEPGGNDPPNPRRISHTDWYQVQLGKSDVTDEVEKDMKRQLRRGDCRALNLYIKRTDPDDFGWVESPWRLQSDDPATRRNALEQDGIVINCMVLPGGSKEFFNEGDTVCHETGHWLGLYHTFHDGCQGDGDMVSDTPPQKESGWSCRDFGRKSCRGNTEGIDSITNFMDYTQDCCLFQFTPGQVERMIDVYDLYRANGCPPL